MAEYKYAQYLHDSTDRVFDPAFDPATPAPRSGIYRCAQCGRECVSMLGQPLPGQNHHPHIPPRPIRWRLIAAAAQL